MKENLEEIFNNKVYVIDVPGYSKQYKDGAIKGYIKSNNKCYSIFLEPFKEADYQLYSIEELGFTKGGVMLSELEYD